MATFLFTYRSPEDSVPGGEGVVEAWNAYFEGMGPSPGPTSALWAAIHWWRPKTSVMLSLGCPFLVSGGGVEVGVVAKTPSSEKRKK